MNNRDDDDPEKKRATPTSGTNLRPKDMKTGWRVAILVCPDLVAQNFRRTRTKYT
jgi:hypothetical protein